MIELLKTVPMVSNLYKELESDISDLEKIERINQFDKRRTALVIFITIGSFALFSWFSYVLYLWFGYYSWIPNLLALFVVMLIGLVFNRLKKPGSPDYYLAVWHPFMTFTCQNGLTCSVTAMMTDFNFYLLAFSAVLLLGTYVHYLGGYELLKEKLVRKATFTLSFTMASGESFEAELISITKRGDFIILTEESEILLNRQHVQKVSQKKMKV
ncbi:hypothetical protein [Brevibacillus choshinensis]|uniref:hypothetical protein n=1 Tax=Brevibacillus choshinensis TaxID=54911 RepID=UPI002E242E2E|nr:hypothetical protein [Brevibacillus choshinensis]